MEPLQTQAAPETKQHFLDYWRIIRLRKTVILAVFLLVVITATLVTFILPEYYEGRVRIRVEQDMSDIQGFTEAQRYHNYDPFFIQTEFEVIQSEVVLGKVIDALDLNTEWGKKYYGGEKLQPMETLRLLKRRIDLHPIRSTSLIEIRVYSEDPKEAARLANAIAEAYCDYRLEVRKVQASGGIKALEERFAEQEKKIREVQEQADKLRSELKISDVEASGTTPTPLLEAETLRRFEAQRIERQMVYTSKEKQLSELKMLSKEKLKEVLPRVVTDQNLTQLLTWLNAAEQKLVVLKKDYAPEHPDVVRTQSQVDEIKKEIDDSVDGIMAGLENQVQAEKAALDKLVANVEEARKQDADKAEKSRPYFDKKRELDELITFRRILTMKLEAEQIDVKLPKTGVVTITDHAKPALKPVKPDKTLNITLGVIVGLIVGIGLAFFIEYLDTSVKTIDDVERSLQSPVLGVIPQNVGALIDEGVESPHAEAYRVLRTNLLFSRKDDQLNTLAVVSAGAGEGKSTTVLNLATVFAQSGQRVLVVDSDLRRPTLHKMLRVSNSLGLTNYLMKQNTLDQVIQTSSLPNLHFMASGKLPSSSLGILSSGQMKDLIAELKKRYEFVFFDSPPIMGVSDASILASEVDLALQVIQYRRYPQPMNIRAKQMIEKVGGNLVGIILNNINMSQDEGYYYYSGYYHDYYSKNEATSDTPVADKISGDKKTPEIKQKY